MVAPRYVKVNIFNNFQIVSVDGDGWRLVCILSHDIWLLQAIGQAKLFAGMREVAHELLKTTSYGGGRLNSLLPDLV